VEARLADCVNILPEIRSIYSWQGETRDDKETLLVAAIWSRCATRPGLNNLRQVTQP
jgi:uncharacterized protein involved in tolerance to divalent cations